MITEWSIYWWMKLDAIIITCGVIGGLLIIGGITVLIAQFANDEWDGSTESIRLLKIVVGALMVGLLLVSAAILTPNSKTYLLMKTVPPVMNSPLMGKVLRYGAHQIEDLVSEDGEE